MRTGRIRWLVLLVLPMVMPLAWMGRAFAQPVTYQVITDEVEATMPDGSDVEVYRFDPAVYVVNQGDDVTLVIRGVRGHDHPVELEGYGLHTVVRKGETVRLQFRADKPGIFRLICSEHADATHKGPMEGYLVVVPPAKANGAHHNAP